MRLSAVLLPLAAAVFSAGAAHAQQYCRDYTAPGALLGGAAGAGLGYWAANAGSQTEGAVLGGLLGAGLGALVGAESGDCYYPDGFYGYPSGYAQPYYGQAPYGRAYPGSYYQSYYRQPYYDPYYNSGSYSRAGTYGNSVWVSSSRGGRYVSPYYTRTYYYNTPVYYDPYPRSYYSSYYSSYDAYPYYRAASNYGYYPPYRGGGVSYNYSSYDRYSYDRYGPRGGRW